MEVLDVFFYKLSRALIALKELWINYYYTATRVEQNYFLLLVFLIVLFFAMLFVLILRLNFNRRIKKLGFVNITHINIANEVYNKNWFLRAVFFIWNFKKLVIVETTPFAAKMENEQDEVDVPQIVDSKMKKSVKPVEKQLEKPMEQPVKNVPSKVFLSKDVEDYIEERISLRTLTLEESLQDYVISLIKNNSDIDLQTIVTPKPVINEPIDDFEEPIEVLEETVEEVQEEPATVYEEPVFIQVESIVQEEPEEVQEEPATVYEEPVFAQEKSVIQEEPATPIYEEPAVQEEPEVQEEPIVPKKVVEEVIDEDAEFDAFFNKDKGKKYVVCKHPISGWQVKKEGSKRASRLFNTKKQAINFAIKSKFDYEIK